MERASVAIPRAGEVVSGINVTLAAPAPHYLRVEVCGPDGTRLRRGFPLVVEMSKTVRGVVVRNRDAGMAVSATVEGRRATVTLTRDPFIPPEPWRVVILLRVDGGLGEGHLLVGSERYPLPTSFAVGQPTVVLGPGCDERYAGESAPGRTSGRLQTARDDCTLHEPDCDCLHGFSGRFMAQKGRGASGKQQIRAMGSLFYGRATSCLTTRYAAPYVSAQRRPLVHIGTNIAKLDKIDVQPRTSQSPYAKGQPHVHKQAGEWFGSADQPV